MAEARRMGKSELFSHFAERFEMKRTQSREFFDELEITNLAVYHDPQARAGRELGAPGLPTTVVIDRTGREVGRLLGPAEWDSAEALAAIKALLGPSGSDS